MNAHLIQIFSFIIMIFLVIAPGKALGQKTAEEVNGSKNLKAYVQHLETGYTVGCGDILAVHVYHHDDFNQENILVRCDGFASFHGVGEVYVNGRTVDEISADVKDRLSELLVDPIVTVTVSQTKPGTAYVSGAVMKPGMYQFVTNPGNVNGGGSQSGPLSRLDFRLSNILSNAGGVQLNADLSRVEIKRAGKLVYRVNLWETLENGDSSQDVFIQSGDSIYIPEIPQLTLNDEDYLTLLRSTVGPSDFPVRIIGQVQAPGLVNLPATSPYLNSAIAQAGGYNPSANRKVIAIRRFTGPYDMSDIHVDPNKHDFILRPNDVIFISENKVYKAGRFTEQADRILSPFRSAASSIFGAALIFGR